MISKGEYIYMRLQKFLAHCGIDSRRKCEKYIQEDRVKVNGKIIRELGYKINPDIDRVEFDDQLVSQFEDTVYIVLNKPMGYVTTVKDQFSRKTVVDLISGVQERVYPVGRLDYDTEGLLILTNDGNITYHLTHPKHEIEKEYTALLKGIPSMSEINNFKKGLKIEDYITSPADFEIINIKKGNALVKIVIHEGKNRQIRKMCDSIGHPVISLKRVRIGKIHLEQLPLGAWRYLSNKEIDYLKNIK